MYNPRVHMRIIYLSNHAQIQKVLPEGSNSDEVFFVLFFFRRKTIQIALKAGH